MTYTTGRITTGYYYSPVVIISKVYGIDWIPPFTINISLATGGSKWLLFIFTLSVKFSSFTLIIIITIHSIRNLQLPAMNKRFLKSFSKLAFRVKKLFMENLRASQIEKCVSAWKTNYFEKCHTSH